MATREALDQREEDGDNEDASTTINPSWNDEANFHVRFCRAAITSRYARIESRAIAL